LQNNKEQGYKWDIGTTTRKGTVAHDKKRGRLQGPEDDG